MAKPTSGTALDSGGILYSQLTAVGSAVWAALEGSGNTSADSSGNGHTLTLDSTVTWGTNGAGEAILSCAGTTGVTVAIASPIILLAAASWSFAFRMKGNANDVYYSLFGKDSAGVFIVNGNNLAAYEPATGNNKVFTGNTAWTTDADWLLVYDQPALRLHLYRNGVELSDSPNTLAGLDGNWNFTELGSGFGTSGLVGTITYGYLMAGYAASGTDATALHADPYVIFGGGAPAFSEPARQNLPPCILVL